jgi:hypothetical protein
VLAALAVETKRKVSAELVSAAWGRLSFTTEIDQELLVKFMADARAAGLLKETRALDQLFSGKP